MQFLRVALDLQPLPALSLPAGTVRGTRQRRHAILHGRRFFDSRNVQKSVTQIIYLGPQPSGPQGPISTPLRPSVSSATRAAVLISHGEFCRVLSCMVPTLPTQATGASGIYAGAARREAAPIDSHGVCRNRGTSCAAADRQRQLRRAQRSPVSRPLLNSLASRTAPRSSYGAPPRVAPLR